MSVSGVSGSVTAASVKIEANYAKATVNAKNDTGKDAKETVEKTDSFVRSEPRQEVGYGNIKGLSTDQVNELNDQRLSSLRNMVEKLLNEQAGKASSLDYSSLNINISIDISTIAGSGEATGANSIYDDPNFGVDAMATKLMDMAISLSGGDSSKADVLMAAVQKGFDQATGAWGKELPGVCQATLKEVNNRFDYWKENGSMDGYQFSGYEVIED